MRKSTFRSLVLVCALLFVAIAAVGCQTPAPPAAPTDAPADPVSTQTPEDESTNAVDTVYKFAMIAPLTGNNAQYGITYRDTLEILVDKVNADGGINGGKVVIEYYDDKNDPKETVNIATKLVSDKELLGVVGSQTSSCSMAAAPLFQEAGIVMISPQASHPDFTSIGDYIFRCQVTTAIENEEAVKYIANELNKNKIAIIYSNDDWGLSMYNSLDAALQKHVGTSFVAAETFVTGQTKDFTPLISKIKLANPDLFYLAMGYADAVQVIQQAKGLELNVDFIGSNMLYKQEFVDVGGENVEGVMISNTIPIENDSEEYQWLKQAYEAKTGAFVDTYVTQSYDSLNLLINAAREAGADRAAIRDNIANITNYNGMSGTFMFNENRDPIKTVYMYQIKDGVVVDVTK